MAEFLERMDGNASQVFVNNSTGASIRGFPVATQVTGHVMFDVTPETTLETRRKFFEDKETSKELIRPLEGAEQLNIAKGDFVFQKILKDSPDIYDDANPFSVFNGLELEKNDGEYHNKYRFLGVAMDGYNFTEGSLAHRGMDIQVSGMVNWINGSDRTVYPGERITWVPDYSNFSNTHGEKKRCKYTASSISKARLLPVEDDISKLLEWAESGGKEDIPVKITAKIPKLKLEEETDRVTLIRYAAQIIREITKRTLHAPIGICRSPTAANSIGQMELL